MSKSNNSGRKKNKNKLKTKNNGNVGEAQDKEETIDSGNISAILDTIDAIKVSDSESHDDNKQENPFTLAEFADKKFTRKDSSTEHLPVTEDFTNVTSTLSMRNTINDLFSLIHSGEVILLLPNRAWSVHCTSWPQRSIVISEAVVRHNSETGLVPTYIKQIVFDEELNYELFLLNSKAVKTKSHSVETVDDVINIIASANNLKLCTGGPEVSAYCNINPECAYRDYNERWRHNLCSLEVSKSETCGSCLSLDEILRRYAQRSKQTAKSKTFFGSAKRKRISQ